MTGSTEPEENVQRRARQLAIRHLEETQHKGVDSLDYDLARVSQRHLFGTRKDGRPYPKRGEFVDLDVRGAARGIQKYDEILSHFTNVAEENHLPASYAYHLIENASPSTLMVRFKLSRDEVDRLKEIARISAREGER